MIKKVAAFSVAVLLGASSLTALAQAPAAPAPAAPAPAAKVAPPAAKVTPAPAKTLVGAKAPPAVNACKGLTEADCGAKADECSYVKAYKTKAGRTVAGYCKSKPKPKSAAAAAPKVPAPATTAVKPSAPATKN